jgi:CheY-like chemotaxis protein
MCNFPQWFLAGRGSALALGHPIMAMPLSDSILVIDDDADNRDLVIASLQAKGFTAHAASDGATALVLADAQRPRVILLDLTMPSHGGLETTRRLRTLTSIRDTTIIAVTARAFATDRDDADRAGCNFFVPKPFKLTALANFIDDLLHPSAASRPITPRLSSKSVVH